MRVARTGPTALARATAAPRVLVVTQAATTPAVTSSQRVKTTAGSTTTSRKPRTTGSSGTLSRRPPQEPEQPKPPSKASQFYAFLTGFPFPLGPTFTRETRRYEVEKGSVWIFEQTQALEVFNVYTPVRMTVIKLKSGGLWVHAPVAPTDECVRLIKELGAPVEYIVLPTFAYEHKAFVGPFSRKFPQAKVYVAPYQWSFPLNLPPQFFGIFPAGELRSDDPDVPWADEIAQKAFLPPPIGVGDFVRFSEVAFFHKRSRTLLVTDAVIYVSDQPPEVIPDDALLDLGRDNYLSQFVAGGKTREEVKRIARPELQDTDEARRKGWIRMVLLVLFFGPSNLLEPEESFAALSNRLMVGPVVETLVYSKVKAAVRTWVDEICGEWNFRQVIPCHFDAPVRTSPAEFKRAFAFAYEGIEEAGSPEPAGPPSIIDRLSALFNAAPVPGAGKLTRPVVFPEADMRTLNTLNDTLLKLGVVRSNADAQ